MTKMNLEHIDMDRNKEIVNRVSQWLMAEGIEPREISDEVFSQGGVELLRQMLALLGQVSEDVSATDWLAALAAGCEQVADDMAAYIDTRRDEGERKAIKAYPSVWLHCLVCDECRELLEIAEETVSTLGVEFREALEDVLAEVGLLKRPVPQKAPAAAETLRGAVTRIVLEVKRTWRETADALSALGVQYRVQPVLSLGREEKRRREREEERTRAMQEGLAALERPGRVSRAREEREEAGLVEEAPLRHEFSVELEEGAAILTLDVEERPQEKWEIVAAVEVKREMDWRQVTLTLGPQRVDGPCTPGTRLDVRGRATAGDYECAVEFSGPGPQQPQRYEYKLRIEQAHSE